MSRTEIVQIAFDGVLSLTQMMIKEEFKYLGEAIFSSQIDVLNLHSARNLFKGIYPPGGYGIIKEKIGFDFETGGRMTMEEAKGLGYPFRAPGDLPDPEFEEEEPGILVQKDGTND